MSPKLLTMARLVLLIVAPALAAASSGTTPAELTQKEHRQIESALRERVASLAREKNELGIRYRRGTYSTDFHRTSANTVLASFHEDEAGATQLETKRLTLTLSRENATGPWAITDEKVEDRYNEMYRSTPGDEAFFVFDEFHFEREGLKINARHGSLIKDTRHGDCESFTLAADALSYSYAPPVDAGFFDSHAVRMREKSRTLDFEPGLVEISGVPVSCHEILESSFAGLQETELGSLDQKLIKWYEKTLKDRRRELEKKPFSGFSGLPETDRRSWAIRIQQKRSSKHLTVDFDNYEPWEVRVWATNSNQPLYGYYSEATRKSSSSQVSLERRDDRSGRDFEISGLQGTIELALADRESMTADLLYRLRAKHDLPYLDFAIVRLQINTGAKAAKHPQLLINSIQDEEGHELTWVRTGPISGRLILPEPLLAGHYKTLHIQFENRNCIHDLSDSYKGLARFGWLPFVRFGDMIHYFDLTVKAPARYKTLGVGSKISDEVEGKVRTTHWMSKSPVVFPTVIFGDYFEDTPTQVARKLDGTEIPVVIHVDKQGMIDWNIRLKQLRPLAEQAVSAINFYTNLFQVDYPYGKMDLVNDPLGALYGQSPSSIIYLGSGAFRGMGFQVHTFGEMGMSGTALTNFARNLIPHEVAHQWWGSAITNANMRNYWFIESLAEYSSALYTEAAYGKKAYQERVDYWRRSVLETTPLSSVQNASALWSDNGYISSVYNKGPYAFHILRKTFGDRQFFAFFRQLARELSGKEIVTRDIQRVAEKAYGQDLSWFFDQWIRGVGIPEYCFDYKTRQTEDGEYMIEGKVLQRVVGGTRRQVLEGVYFTGLVPLSIKCSGGKVYQRRILIKGAETPIQVKVHEKPTSVVLNEHGEVLAHQVRRASSF